MSIFNVRKEIHQLPNNLEPDTVYYIRTGKGFSQYITDHTGRVAFPINPTPFQLSNPYSLPIPDECFRTDFWKCNPDSSIRQNSNKNFIYNPRSTKTVLTSDLICLGDCEYDLIVSSQCASKATIKCSVYTKDHRLLKSFSIHPNIGSYYVDSIINLYYKNEIIYLKFEFLGEADTYISSISLRPYQGPETKTLFMKQNLTWNFDASDTEWNNDSGRELYELTITPDLPSYVIGINPRLTFQRRLTASYYAYGYGGDYGSDYISGTLTGEAITQSYSTNIHFAHKSLKAGKTYMLVFYASADVKSDYVFKLEGSRFINPVTIVETLSSDTSIIRFVFTIKNDDILSFTTPSLKLSISHTFSDAQNIVLSLSDFMILPYKSFIHKLQQLFYTPLPSNNPLTKINLSKVVAKNFLNSVPLNLNKPSNVPYGINFSKSSLSSARASAFGLTNKAISAGNTVLLLSIVLPYKAYLFICYNQYGSQLNYDTITLAQLLNSNIFYNIQTNFNNLKANPVNTANAHSYIFEKTGVPLECYCELSAPTFTSSNSSPGSVSIRSALSELFQLFPHYIGD